LQKLPAGARCVEMSQAVHVCGACHAAAFGAGYVGRRPARMPTHPLRQPPGCQQAGVACPCRSCHRTAWQASVGCVLGTAAWMHREPPDSWCLLGRIRRQRTMRCQKTRPPTPSTGCAALAPHEPAAALRRELAARLAQRVLRVGQRSHVLIHVDPAALWRLVHRKVLQVHGGW
jgi:hypothetical protein